MKVNILSLGITAPGLVNFASFKKLIKSGQAPDISQPLEKYSPAFLPANERRRTTATIKLALATAEEAWNHYRGCYPDETDQIPVLFVSRDGDTMISARMCEAVNDEEPMISPTHFHNSVHNAPAGYWMIGQNNQAPASAISVGSFSIANGLLEAVLQSQTAAKPVLVVFYDLPVDPAIPTNFNQPQNVPFACSMVLSADDLIQSDEFPSLTIKLDREPGNHKEDNPYKGVPAAEAYTLLKSMILVENKVGPFEISYPISKNNFIKVVIS
ncbi:MAG: beta-ketoacyl synthase chain length factor [Pseudomonadota bacterium]|nr:beta-ketoacyl synthase chain length factor [Pseudomonadota bacterium]